MLLPCCQYLYAHESFPDVQVLFEDDLVDTCIPGSRISVVGIYTAQLPRAVGKISGDARTVLLANSVKPLYCELESQVTADDIRYQPPPMHLTSGYNQQLWHSILLTST